jgi:hypothetical protein
VTVQLQVCCLLAALLAACGQSTRVYLGEDRQDAPLASAGKSAPPPTAELPDATPAAVPDAAVPVLDAGAPAVAGSPSALPPPPPEPPTTPVCAAGRGDCDGDASNGCEADLMTSAQHCGDCAVACAQSDCACEDGVPVLQGPEGRQDCDGDAANGCETATDSDSANCGSCGHACSEDGANVASVACEASKCVVTCTGAALALRGDCDGNPDNGCETLLWNDRNNCGKCGNRCVFCDEGNCL